MTNLTKWVYIVKFVQMRLVGQRLERARASAQFREGKFRNTAKVTAGLQKGSTGGVMREFLFGGKKRKPPAAIPVTSPLDAWGSDPGRDELRVTWLGHSTNLIESGRRRILTDPVFGERLGPVSFAGPKRFHATPATLAQLPAIDVVLISHDHYDHLCKTTVNALAAMRVPIVTSLGVGAYLEAFGVERALVTELDWWESAVIAGVSFTAAPSQHFSGRLGGGRNTTLWSSWAIQTDRHKVFFSGDTGLTDAFLDVGAKLGPFDLVMLEIGAWNPAWGTIHLGPENALTAFEMLGGGTLLPVHWGTFDLGLHPWAEPAETLVTLAAARGARIVTPMLGEVFVPSRVEGVTPWWRAVGADRSPAREAASSLAVGEV